MNLTSSQTYKDATPAERDAVCNGCGSKGFGGWVIPDTIYFLSIKDVCDIHDWDYGEGVTLADKGAADRRMYNNMLRKIEVSAKWLRPARRWRANTYYVAVKKLGGPAYWEGKDG